MKIRKVRAIPITIPLSRDYVHAHGPVSGFTNPIVEVTTDEGIKGYGEVNVVEGITSDTVTTAVDIVENYIGRDLIGKDPFDIERLVEVMDKKVRGNWSAKTGIEYALWDIMGKYLKQPVYKLLGGKFADQIDVDYTLSMNTPEKMAKMAVNMMRYGYDAFVVKVGINSELDVARLAAVRKAVGPKVKLRLDINEAYTADKAIRMIKSFEKYDPELAEQPLPRWDVKGMARVTRSVDTPISADEGNSSPQAALQLIENEAADVLNIKPPYHGGLWNAKKVASIAYSAGVPIIVGGVLQFEISRQASRHFAISTKMANAGYTHEGPGPASQALTGNVTKRVISYNDVKKWGGHVELSDEPGLGFEIDWAQVKKFSRGAA